MPSRRGGRRWRPRALPGAGWDRHRWSSTTSRPWYFEADTGDGFREPGFSKERRLEPQITIGLRTDATGFPLMVNAFEGNKAETTTLVSGGRQSRGEAVVRLVRHAGRDRRADTAPGLIMAVPLPA